jgi:hypothetical protein
MSISHSGSSNLSGVAGEAAGCPGLDLGVAVVVTPM